MTLIEKIVYGFLSLQVIVFLFLLLCLVFTKIREAGRQKKISLITAQIEPILLPILEEASKSQELEPVLAKLKPYLKSELMQETVAEFLCRHIEQTAGARGGSSASWQNGLGSWTGKSGVCTSAASTPKP